MSTIEEQPMPLSMDEDGVMRVGRTRVTLETLVAAFDEGCTCEEIAHQYPSLPLSDIYLAIGYYLSHGDELSPYLDRRAAEHADVRSKRPLAPGESNREIRARLVKRRQTGG